MQSVTARDRGGTDERHLTDMPPHASPPSLKRNISVNFANGDTYRGNCILTDGGEERHGFGTYIYTSGTHESYKQYQGQWREDKKHGHGVLFYRSGGAYVGQWENNQK